MGRHRGKTCYPPFVNPESRRAIKEAHGQPILQAHDREQLSLNISHYRGRQQRPRQVRQPYKPAVKSLLRNYHIGGLAHRWRMSLAV